MTELPLFATSLMGSLPRSKTLLSALRQHRKGLLSDMDFAQQVEQATAAVIALQEQWGVDIVTSGELGRDNYVSFVADRLTGVTMMDMGQMLDYIEDKKAFEQILTTLDVPAVSIKNAICNGKLGYRPEGISVPELLMMQRHTNRPLKITLPGPYLMTRSMWLSGLSSQAYDSKEALGQDVVTLLMQEIDALQRLGVEIIQFDEPVLTEVIFTEGKPRSFMCAALSERKDPTEELLFAASLLKPVLAHVAKGSARAALHVCRGNWSRDESILLEGPYSPLLELFNTVAAPLLELEFSTPRAGDLTALLQDNRWPRQTTLGLGVINPRSDEVESVQAIVSRVEEALRWLAPEQILLVPDCGFATFANRPVNHYQVIEQKVTAMVAAAQVLRQRYG